MLANLQVPLADTAVLIRRIGCALLALMTAVLGAISIYTGDFAYTWQPVPEDLPLRALAARVSGIVLIGASVLFLSPRTARRGLTVMSVMFAVWLLLLHVPRLIAGENWLGSCEFLLPVGACLALIGMTAPEERSALWPNWLAGNRAILLGRVCFGVGLIGCGASHFVYAEPAAQLIPAWMPARLFFTYLTGVGHIAAGLSLITGILMRVSTASLCFMFACIVLLLHVPRVIGDPGSRLEWTMLFVSTLFSGAAWIMAAAVRSHAATRFLDQSMRKDESAHAAMR
jgi:uncharacterized membrane protein